MTSSNVKHITFMLLLCLLASLSLLAARTPMAQAAQTKVDIPYTQVFTTTDTTVTDTFAYTMTATDYKATTPMPTGSTAGVYNFSVKGNASGSISFDTAGAPEGTYTYIVRDANAPKSGYTYEARTYTITVYFDGSNAVATVERDSDGKKVSAIELDPSYKAPVVTNGEITVKKSITSKDFRAGGTVVYSLTIKSVGTVDAVGVWVKDHIPDYTNYSAASDGGVFIDDGGRGSVNWFVKKLAPGTSMTVTLTVTLDEDLPADAQVRNIAQFQVTGSEADPDFEKYPINKADSGGGDSNEVALNADGVDDDGDGSDDVEGSATDTGDMLMRFAPIAAVIALICVVGAIIVYRRSKHHE